MATNYEEMLSEWDEQAAKAKLKELTEIAQELSELWCPVLDKGYPFTGSFDEVVRDLLAWNHQVTTNKEVSVREGLKRGTRPTRPI